VIGRGTCPHQPDSAIYQKIIEVLSANGLGRVIELPQIAVMGEISYLLRKSKISSISIIFELNAGSHQFTA
jgi:hypothetical protein